MGHSQRKNVSRVESLSQALCELSLFRYYILLGIFYNFGFFLLMTLLTALAFMFVRWRGKYVCMLVHVSSKGTQSLYHHVLTQSVGLSRAAKHAQTACDLSSGHACVSECLIFVTHNADTKLVFAVVCGGIRKSSVC